MNAAHALRAGGWRSPRPPLRVLAVAVAALALAAGAWLWIRDSSFVRVEDVFITGVSSDRERDVRRALRAAAMDMTTLHVREDVLRTAVAPFGSVAAIRTDADFPHGLTIEVVEHAPVAAVALGGRVVAVSASGVVLEGARGLGDLPRVKARGAAAGGRVGDRRAVAAVAVLGAAPERLRSRVERVRTAGARGLVLSLRDGPDLVFGSPARVRAKWAAAARVLAEPSAAGATYVDVRLPERPAAGGVAPDDDAAAQPQVPAAGGQAGVQPEAPVQPLPQTTPAPGPDVQP